MICCVPIVLLLQIKNSSKYKVQLSTILDNNKNYHYDCLLKFKSITSVQLTITTSTKTV